MSKALSKADLHRALVRRCNRAGLFEARLDFGGMARVPCIRARCAEGLHFEVRLRDEKSWLPADPESVAFRQDEQDLQDGKSRPHPVPPVNPVRRP